MSGLISRMSVYTHFSLSSQLLPTPGAAHCESLCPPKRQQGTICSRTCQGPLKHWLEWVVTSKTTRALLQILLHSLNSQKKATNAYNDVARKDFIYSTFSQSSLCYPISQTLLCTCFSSGCGGEGCHGDELWQEAGGNSLKGQTSVHIHWNDRIYILFASDFQTPTRLPVYKPLCMHNYACKYLRWSCIATGLPNS